MSKCCGDNKNVTDGLTVDTAAAICRAWMDTELPKLTYPADQFTGRGVVIVAGGPRHSICAWVCLRALRHVGCKLPVQIWYLGEREFNPAFAELCDGFGAAHVDARQVQQQHPHARLNGWETKPYAITWSPFDEVLLLDADNVPVRDPTYLFDTREYRETGTVLWPDYHRCPKHSGAWKIFGLPYINEPEVESGQVIVDKARAWPALQLANWYCERSAFYFKHVYGDKEIFHRAWPVAGCPYAMPSRPIFTLRPGVMCQHDFDGKRVFQHRNWQRWEFEKNIPRPGFLLEQECLQWIAELADNWSPAAHTLPTPADRAAIATAAHQWLYTRVGHDKRPVTLAANGTFAAGGAKCERYWTIRGDRLKIACADARLTMDLEPDGNGGWRGAWLIYEKMPITLRPL